MRNSELSRQPLAATLARQQRTHPIHRRPSDLRGSRIVKPPSPDHAMPPPRLPNPFEHLFELGALVSFGILGAFFLDYALVMLVLTGKL
jgi:hypothetical protein